MKQRWAIYLLVGLLFGFFDFYYHGFASNWIERQQVFTGGVKTLLWWLLTVGIWLVPLLPVALHEARKSGSRRQSALASISMWTTAVFAYYLTNAVQLAFLSVPGRPELHFSNRAAPHFWANWAGVLRGDIFGGMLVWIVVAVFGGSVLGFLVAFLRLRLEKSSYD